MSQNPAGNYPSFQDEGLVFVGRTNAKEFTFGGYDNQATRASVCNDETWENKNTVPPSNFARLVQLTPFKKKTSLVKSEKTEY